MKKSVSKWDMQLTPDQCVSIEIKSLFSSEGDKRIMFPLGL